jgi:tRNA(His) guanylyltransferase
MKKDKMLDEQSLGGRLKGYEKEYEKEIPSESHIICRIDGHHFSKYTKGLNKPYDDILHRAMVETTKDLVERFNAYTGYTQSDEITLFIPSLKDVSIEADTSKKKNRQHKDQKRIREDWTHGFSGRVQKMSSLIAGFTTMSFNKHFERLVEFYGADNNYDERYRLLMDKSGNAYFDCRVYGVDDLDEVFNSFMWRCRDAEKNSKSMYSQAYCSHKQLQGLTGEEQVQFCKEKTGNDWNEVDEAYKYGVFVKKELYEKPVDFRDLNYSERSDEPRKTVTRSRICEFTNKLTSYSPDVVKMIGGQYK